MRPRTIMVAAALFALLGGVAQTQRASYPVMPPGSKTCDDWFDDFSDHVLHNAELSWSLGFVSGAAWQGLNIRDGKARDVEAWVTLYCRENPRATLVSASETLAKSLIER